MKATLNRLADRLRSRLVTVDMRNLPVPEVDPRKALFNEVQRRLKIYLRALWECEFEIKQAEIDGLGYEVDGSFIEYFAINLPTVFYDQALAADKIVSGLDIYRAAAAHAAAHIMFRKKHLSKRSLTEWQRSVIALFEDARIEHLAIRSFPGLKQLWARQHSATPDDKKTAADFLNRLSRALLDEHYQDDDPWVVQGRAMFNAVTELEDELFPRNFGLILADSFLEKKIKLKSSDGGKRAPYRDDNRYLWTEQQEPLEIINPYLKSKATVGIEETDEDTKKSNSKKIEQQASRKPNAATYFYPEWNYRTQAEDQAWVTLREQTPPSGELKIIDEIVARNSHLISRMKALLRAVRDGSASPVRKLEEGENVDINAAIRAQMDIRQGIPPDTRIMMRSERKTRDIAVLMLLDLSRSMNNVIAERQMTALQLTQEACVLFAEAIAAVGDPFAIHGFHSDGRHFVDYSRIKDFDQAYDDIPKAKIAAINAQRSTRMGAAIRHATHLLDAQKTSKKLLLILTDGEPKDVDTLDRRYLPADTRQAVVDAKRNGVHTYCINLDPNADKYVARIFGASNYMVVDHIKNLPEKILLIYAGLAR